MTGVENNTRAQCPLPFCICCVQRRRTWTGDFKCREVKTGFYRNRSMQTGSSGTLIGWKSGQTTFVPLWDWMEGAWLRTQYSTVVQYNIEAACTIFTLQTSSKPLLHGGGGGGGVTMSSCTVLHSCHPVTNKILIKAYKFDLFTVVIYSIL